MRSAQRYDIRNLFGGLNRSIPRDMLPDNQAYLMTNFVLRDRGPEKCLGYEKFTSQVLTDAAASPAALKAVRIEEVILNDGSRVLLALTNRRPYFFEEVTNLWTPFWPPASGVSTTVDADSAAGGTTLNVAATTGFAVDDAVIIHRNGARQEIGVVASISAGVSLTLRANLSFAHTAAQADSVEKLCQTINVTNSAAQTYLDINDTTGYLAGMEILAGWGTANQEYLLVSSVASGTRLNITRPTWAPSGTGLQFTHTGSNYELCLRLSTALHTDTSTFDADFYNNCYYFTGVDPEAQKLSFTTITKGTTTSAIVLCGDLERGSITGNAGLRTCEGLVAGTLVRPKHLKVFENFIVIGDLTESSTDTPQKIRWCQYLDPTLWANATDGSGEAGYFTFDHGDEIRALRQLKRELIVYRENRVEAMTYVGYPNVFSFRTAGTEKGLLGAGAICDIGDVHVFVSSDNIYAFDGVSFTAIGNNIKSFFFDRLDPSQRSNVELFYYKEDSEIRVCYSTTTSNVHDEALCYNLLTHEWSGPVGMHGTCYGRYARQTTTTWDTWTATWADHGESWDDRSALSGQPLKLSGDESGYIYSLDTVYTADGSAITARYETGLKDFGLPYMNKRCVGVGLGTDVGGSYTIDVYLGSAGFPGDNITWNGPVTLNMDYGKDHLLAFDARGCYFALAVETNQIICNLRNITFFFKPGAAR